SSTVAPLLQGMVRALLVLVGFSALFALASAQCALGDHPNCANWVRNGFCQNQFYSKTMLQQYCPKACANSGCGGGNAAATTAAPAAAKVENKNCDKWNKDPAIAFCAAMEKEQKEAFCFTTCAKELAPTDGCTLYVNKAGTVTTLSDPGAAAPVAVATGATAADPILHVYVKDGCTLQFQDATPGNVGAVKNGAAPNFFPITETVEKEAPNFLCTCP
ncbi:hypothetical protein PMAYCL1PPCAC_16675, partial [Pristionchus mayeri]